LLITILFISICYSFGEPYSILEKENTNFEPDNQFFDSLNVRFVGSWPFGDSRAVAYDSIRSIAFLGSGGGVYTIDVSDPTNPVKLSEKIHTRGMVFSLFFDKNSQVLYIASYGSGLDIWDVSNVYNPSKICSYQNTPLVCAIFVSDSLAYVGENAMLLHILNISDPYNPQEIGVWSTSQLPVYSVYKIDSLVYVGSFGFFIIDVSIPEEPKEIAYWDSSQNNIFDIAVCSSFVYVVEQGEYGGLRILDISNPHNIEEMGFCLTSFCAWQFQISDSLAYVADNMGFAVIKISEPTNPHLISYDYNLRCEGVCVSIPFAYTAARWKEGLRIIDISNPSNPYLKGQFESPNRSNDIWLSYPFAYLANGGGGLRILDISDVNTPREISFCRIPHEVQSIFVVDSLAYVACHKQDQGIRIINIRDENNPFVIGQCSIPGRAYDVFVQDTFTYVTDTDWFQGRAGIRIINVSDPTNPYQVNYYPMSRPCYNIFVRDTLAYFTERDLYIVDISDPYNISQVGYFNTPPYAQGVYLQGDTAYVTIGYTGPNTGLLIIDISDPTNPQLISHFRTPGNAENCFVEDSYAYVADGSDGLQIIDISDPFNPRGVGYHETPDKASNVAKLNSYLFVASSYCGLQIFEFYGAGIDEGKKEVSFSPSFKLLQNPIRGNYINIQLLNWNRGNVDICLYNILGQKIKTYTFNNLKDNNNLRLNIDDILSGVYFLRLDGESQTSEKVTILK
jgi:hypothetical protein